MDRLKAIFLCLTFNDLCLTSENVLRREACILARVRQDLILHMKALLFVHVYAKLLCP